MHPVVLLACFLLFAVVEAKPGSSDATLQAANATVAPPAESKAKRSVQGDLAPARSKRAAVTTLAPGPIPSGQVPPQPAGGQGAQPAGQPADQAGQPVAGQPGQLASGQAAGQSNKGKRSVEYKNAVALSRVARQATNANQATTTTMKPKAKRSVFEGQLKRMVRSPDDEEDDYEDEPKPAEEEAPADGEASPDPPADGGDDYGEEEEE